MNGFSQIIAQDAVNFNDFKKSIDKQYYAMYNIV